MGIGTEGGGIAVSPLLRLGRHRKVGAFIEKYRNTETRRRYLPAADHLQCLRGIDDLDAVVVFELAQVRIAGDDDIRFGSERTGQHGIIVGIIVDVYRDVGRDHVLGEQRIAMHQLRHVQTSRLQLAGELAARQDIGEFRQQGCTGKEFDAPFARGVE